MEKKTMPVPPERKSVGTNDDTSDDSKLAFTSQHKRRRVKRAARWWWPALRPASTNERGIRLGLSLSAPYCWASPILFFVGNDRDYRHLSVCFDAPRCLKIRKL